ncbi:MAG: hypothetical protein M0P12_03320 [Paludibacteraceae bacterium]|nr:hypothetical protein [Paludibacteraceae bacterium]MCK9616186.1 hypothetical protein [Candidatus Omnitrophota bacterium]
MTKDTEGINSFSFKHGNFTYDRTSSGHERFSCKCGASVVHQPYMNDLKWNKAVIEFELKHLEMVKDEIE